MRLNSGYVYRHRVAREHAGLGVLAYHVLRFARRSADDWLRTLEAGRLRINGRTAAPADSLRSGDRLEYHRELICGLLAGLALLFAGLWWDTIEVRRVRRAAVDRKRYCDETTSWVVADGAASALSRRAAARKALEGPARRLSRTGRDCDAGERVQLPNHLQSCRVVLLVDPGQSRLADRSRVADQAGGLVGELVDAEERAQLGRDLHDSIAPLLAGAGLTAEALRKGMTPGTTDEEDAERLASRLRNAATEIRRLAHDLQPAPVHDRGLQAALADYIATLETPEMPQIRLHTDIAASLPTAVAQAAYLVVLEALNNVVGHAHAQHCEVTVTLTPGELDLNVKDDGVGLKQPYVSGIGITSMRSRVQALGGTFNLTAAPDRGTLLQARIPVTP